MEHERKVQTEKVKRVKSKKHWLHYLLIYLVCLLVACITWLMIRYSMHTEEKADDHTGTRTAETAYFDGADGDLTRYG